MAVPPATDRLELRLWEWEDLESFHAICSDPCVMRFIGDGRVWSESDSREFIERAMQTFATHGYCQWALVHRGHQQLIGYAGFVYSADGPEVGWRLAADYWGQGLGFEAAAAVVRHGFQQLGFTRILATVQEENLGSRRIIEKLGMRLSQSFSRQGRLVRVYELDRNTEPRS